MGWRACLFRVLVLANLCSQVLTIGATCSKYGQFFGGSVSYTLEDVGGKFTVCLHPHLPSLRKPSYVACRQQNMRILAILPSLVLLTISKVY